MPPLALLQHIDGDITTGRRNFPSQEIQMRKKLRMEEETQGKLVGAVLQSSQKYQNPMELISQNIQGRKYKNYKNQPNKQTARPPHPPDVPDRSSLTEGHYGAGSEMLIGQSSRKWQRARWQRATPLLPANWQLAKWQILKVPDPGHF